VVAGAVVGLVMNSRAKQRCTGPPSSIRVAVSADESGALDRLARWWTADGPAVDGHCVGATVISKPPNDVAAALGGGWDRTRDGEPPHVWIPDSSLWVSVAASRPAGAAVLAERPTSIASSPVVLALRRPLAEALGWPQRSLGWLDVIGAFARPDMWTKAGHPEWARLRVGITDPSRSTAGLASVLSILDPMATGTVRDEQLVGGLGFAQVLGALAPDTVAFFEAQNPNAPPGPNSIVAAFPALERDVAAYDADGPAMPLVAVYGTQLPVVADYPYTVVSADWVSETDRQAAEQFRQYLLTPAAQQALGEAGLRGPDRTAPEAAVAASMPGFQGTVAAPRANPEPAALSRIITEWANLQRQVNLLALLDTSGSMRTPVPGTPLTRIALLQQTASTGFGLLTNTTSIGLWEFSLRTTDPSEYRELVPFGPLPGNIGSVPRRAALAQAVPRMRADGATPLYNTVYAAFHHMQQRWQPNSTNAVLLITDGKNELQGGLSLATLVGNLAREQRRDKPVQIVSIAVGPEADAEALRQISKATGGRTFVARDPATAIQTLILAFTGRLQ
jgi:Ca-activated chloride channel family protein